MSFNKDLVTKRITLATLVAAIVTLPFSITLCHGSLIALIINWFWEGRWKEKWNSIRKNFFLWPFILFFIANIIGLLYSEDTKAGVSIIEKKSFFFLIPVVIATTKIDLKGLHFLFKSFITACVFAIVICTTIAFYRSTQPLENRPLNFDYYTNDGFKLDNPNTSPVWHFFSYQEFSSGIHLHPTYLSLYILFSVLLIFYFFEKTVSAKFHLKLFMVCLLSILSICLVFLSSRVIIASHLLLLVFLIVSLVRNSPSQLPASIPLIILVISILIIFIQPIARYRAIQEIGKTPIEIKSNTVYKQSTEIRLSLWWTALQSISGHNLIWGAGTGDVDKIMRNTSQRFSISNVLGSDDPHNQFLQIVLSLGIIGLILFLGCLLSPFLQAPAFNAHFLYRGFVLIILITCMTESLFESQKGIVFFSLFNSLLIFHFNPVEIPNHRVLYA
jgi:O-antigen ligase